jgi:3-phenylpropionate/cinnamic acid dioxygenase small subunit
MRRLRLASVFVLALATATAPLTAAAEPVTDPAIRAGIEEIVARMNQDLDAEDYEAYIAVWDAGATFEATGQETITGADGVLGYLRKNQELGYITGKRHAVTNLSLRHEGDIVRATYYLAVYEREQVPALIATAVITDDFAQVDGEWRIVRHVTSIDPAMFNAMAAMQRE